MLTAFSAEILDFFVTHLVTLFLPGVDGDDAAARRAALQMLAAYNPVNERELCLAAQSVSFSLHGLAALGQAADPDLPLSRVLRLRGSAVSLSRASDTAQGRLDRCQQARQEVAARNRTRAETVQPPPAQPEPHRQPEPPAQPEPHRQPEPQDKPTPTPPRTVIIAQPIPRAYNRTEDDARIAASLRRAEAIAAGNARQAGFPAPA